MAFLAWCRYTGVVPAAIASVLVARAQAEPALAEPARIAFILVAMAVCATLLAQATTAGWLARRLDLVERDEVQSSSDSCPSGAALRRDAPTPPLDEAAGLHRLEHEARHGSGHVGAPADLDGARGRVDAPPPRARR